MPTCPSGHLTLAGSYCDVCDLPMAATPSPVGQGGGPGARPAPRHAAPAGNRDAAETWQAPGPGYAAGPGYAGGPPPDRTRAQFEWTALATSDPTYFERVAAAGPGLAEIDFPVHCPPRRFRLIGPEVRIGRRSPSRGIEPEIDLTGPPTDFAISHLHAVLTAAPDGSWTLLDPGSANGTQLNGVEIAIGVPVRLHAGDRICIGAWTALTIGIS